MQNESLIEIRLKISAGTATDEEVEIWEQWKNQPHIREMQFVSGEEIELWFKLNKDDKDLQALFEKDDEDLEQHTIEKSQPNIDVNPITEAVPVFDIRQSGWSVRKLLVAAGITVVALTIVLSFFLNNKKTTNQSQQLASVDFITVRTSFKGDTTVVLSDGTKAWLNSNSELIYPSRFTGSKREVKASGEIFFDVAHNKDIPLIVYGPNTEILVLGTSFNFNDYKGSISQKVALIVGSVAVKRKTDTSFYQLKPGEKMTFSPGETDVQQMERLNEATAWQRDSFSYDYDRLSYIVNELANYYGVKMVIEEGVKDSLYTIGSFSRTLPLSEILRGIARTGDMTFKPNKDSIKPGETVLILKGE